jgi:hypothetical protein
MADGPPYATPFLDRVASTTIIRLREPDGPPKAAGAQSRRAPGWVREEEMAETDSTYPVAVRRASYEDEQALNDEIQSLMRAAAESRDEAAKALAASDAAAYRRESRALIASAKGSGRRRQRGAPAG